MANESKNCKSDTGVQDLFMTGFKYAISLPMRYLCLIVLIVPCLAQAQAPSNRCLFFFTPPQIHFVPKEDFLKDFTNTISDPSVISHYDLVEATGTLATAQVVFIGDRHDSPYLPDLPSSQWRVELAETLIRKLSTQFGDLILREHPSKDHAENVSVLSSLPREGGWDSAIHNQLAHSFYEKTLLIHNQVLEALKKPLDFNVENELIKDFFWSQLDFHHYAIQLRDQVLIQSVLKHLKTMKPGAKIFVLAGSHHIDDNWGQIYTALQEQGVSYVAIKGKLAPHEEDNFEAVREQALEYFGIDEERATEIMTDHSSQILDQLLKE